MVIPHACRSAVIFLFVPLCTFICHEEVVSGFVYLAVIS
jgi:hypothetical protein